MSTTNIPLDTKYVLKRLQTKLAAIKKEVAKYEQELVQYEKDIAKFNTQLLTAVLAKATIDDYVVINHSRYYNPDHLSVGLTNRLSERINPEEYGLVVPTHPICEWSAGAIREIEEAIELLKACAKDTFSSKMIGSIGRYL